TTLVNKTLNKDGFGVCNVSGNLVTCPVEIECKMSEAYMHTKRKSELLSSLYGLPYALVHGKRKAN
ncbi:unnamed protein product, partial [Adineta steineri]